uniref:Uncharacterized protein n=1 Tax=Echinococcus canadensis TaxID=519352 RepID=A0A915EYI1_9CEST
MSHMNSTGDESACTDELKVYKDEGEEEEQKKSSENLTEDKVGLVIEGEGHTVSGLSATARRLLYSLETQEVSTIDGSFWYSTKEFVWSNAIFIQCRQEWVQIRLRAGGNKYTQSRFLSVKITYLSRPLPFLSFLPLLIPRWTPFDFNFIEHGASRKFACVSCFKPCLFLFPLCATYTYLPTLLSTLSPLRSPPVHAPAR